MWGFICFLGLLFVMYLTRDKPKKMTLDEIADEEEKRDFPARKAKKDQQEILDRLKYLCQKSYDA